MNSQRNSEHLSARLRFNNDNSTPEAQEALRLIAAHLPPADETSSLDEQLAILAQLAPIRLTPSVQPSPVPIFGGLITAAKRALHQLILFYVNDLAAQQSTFNHQLLQVLQGMAGQPKQP